MMIELLLVFSLGFCAGALSWRLVEKWADGPEIPDWAKDFFDDE